MNIPLTHRLFIILSFITLTCNAIAQDRKAAQQTIIDLCSDDMAGRGYINNGDQKAADYISNRFSKIGLLGTDKGYKLPFNLDVNTFPTAELKIDDKELKPGLDYLVSTTSASASGNFNVFFVSERLLTSPKVAKKVKKAVKRGYVPVICQYNAKDEKLSKHIKNIRKCNAEATLIFLKDHLTWGVGTSQSKGTEIHLIDSLFDRFSKSVSLNIEAKFIQNYESQNVMGIVKGTKYPDSLIIFCGHYDHLGKMGESTFYGANDNASGIAMLLDMASYFAMNPQKYSIAFVAFGGEEAGLLGSLNYVKNPVFPLSQTKFVFNMDLMGSGEGGATIVNGSVFKEDFDRLVTINKNNEYLPSIKSRGKAANSDHYFFSEVGVSSFFIYLRGKYKHYHSPLDSPENLQLGEYYDKSFLLIRDFIISLN